MTCPDGQQYKPIETLQDLSDDTRAENAMKTKGKG
jgi:hypothetical protein